MNASATRFAVMRDYRFFCLKNQVDDKLKGDDKKSLNIFTTMSTWRILFFVNFPQLLILIFAYLYAAGQCPDNTQSTNDCTYLNKISVGVLIGYTVKLFLTSFAVLNFILVIFQYAWVKCKLFVKFRGSKIMTFRKYVAFTLDRIFGMVVLLNPLILFKEEQNDNPPTDCMESLFWNIEHAKKSIKDPYQTGELKSPSSESGPSEVNLTPVSTPVVPEIIIVTPPPAEPQIVIVTVPSQQGIQQS